MIKKTICKWLGGVLVLTFVAGLYAQETHRMLSVTEGGRYCVARLDISEWKPGEDFVSLRSYYVPWQGEDSLDYKIRQGRLEVNGALVGVDLLESSLDSVADKERIMTVQSDPSNVSELVELPNLVALSYVNVRDEDLGKLKEIDNLRALDLAYTKISDLGLNYLASLTELRVLNLAYTSISDEGLKHLSELKHLRSLDLENTNVTDEGLVYLKDLGNLRSLNLFLTPFARAGKLTLRGTMPQISDEGLKSLAGIKTLGELSLHGTAITDKGIEYLSDMSSLRRLDLRATEITDASVAALSKLKNLWFLDLEGTAISSQGLARLQDALPSCEINH